VSVLSTVLVVAVLLAWLAPLIAGLKLLNGPKRTSGIVLTVIGILWAIPSLMGLVLGVMYWTGARSNFEIKDFIPGQSQAVLGIIHTSHHGAGRLVLRPQTGKSATRYTSADGTFQVPVGTYRVEEFAATATDAQGKQWEGVTAFPLKTPAEVTAQTPVEIKVGPPYKAQVKVEQFGATERLSLELTDSANGTASLRKGMTTPPPPSFQLCDKKGKVLYNGKFAYG